MPFSFERRENSRYENYEERKIEYTFRLSDTERYEGLLFNSSESSMCLIIEFTLDMGQEIMVQDDVLWFIKNRDCKMD